MPDTLGNLRAWRALLTQIRERTRKRSFTESSPALSLSSVSLPVSLFLLLPSLLPFLLSLNPPHHHHNAPHVLCLFPLSPSCFLSPSPRPVLSSFPLLFSCFVLGPYLLVLTCYWPRALGFTVVGTTSGFQCGGLLARQVQHPLYLSLTSSSFLKSLSLSSL